MNSPGDDPPPSWMLFKLKQLFAAEGRALLVGLASLLTAAIALGVTAVAATTPSSRYIDWYTKEAQRRTEARDFDGALLCYECLLRVDDGDRAEIRCAQARVYQRKGEFGRALAILEKLAPLDVPGGYSPAHLAVARILLSRRDQSERSQKAIELHLQRALNGSVAAEAGVLLGQVYASSGRGSLAEPYLLKAVGAQPELLFPLARVARAQGKEELARDRAEQARRIYRQKTEARLDDPEARLAWAAASVFLSDFADAITTLKKGQKISADPRYPAAAAQVYVQWARSQPNGKLLSPEVRLNLLEQGLRADPNNRALLLEFGMMFERGGDDIDRLRTILLDTLTNGKAGAGTHALLGYDAHARGRADEARAYWEQAFQLNPKMAVVANNLAWALSHEGSPDLPRALELADRALSREPKNPHFHGTRGFILWKLQRWTEALVDLKAEIAASPERTETHLALADVYDHLDLPEAAASHRQAAARGKTPPAR